MFLTLNSAVIKYNCLINSHFQYLQPENQVSVQLGNLVSCLPGLKTSLSLTHLNISVYYFHANSNNTQYKVKAVSRNVLSIPVHGVIFLCLCVGVSIPRNVDINGERIQGVSQRLVINETIESLPKIRLTFLSKKCHIGFRFQHTGCCSEC